METNPKCGMCSEEFQTPKMLPCFHTFCLKCLQNHIDKLVTRNRIQCPLCRQFSEIPRSGANGFQSNYFIQLDTNQKKLKRVTCSVCGDRARAETFCVECEQDFCQTCTSNHPKLKICKDHHLVSLSGDKQGTNKISGNAFCQSHKENLILYCHKCEQLICSKCLLENHSGHPCVDVIEAAGMVKRDMHNLLNTKTMKNCIPSISKHIEDLTEYETTLRTESKQIIEEVNRCAKKMIEDIEMLRENTIKSVENDVPGEINRVRRRIEAVERGFKSSCGIIECAEHFTKFADDTDMLTKGKKLCSCLETLRNEIDIAQLPDKLALHHIKAGPTDVMARKLLGQISKARTQKYEIRPTPVTSFKCSGVDESVSANAVLGDVGYWVVADERNIRVFEKSGKMKKAIGLKTRVSDLQILNDGRVLVCCPKAKAVKTINRKYEVVDFIHLDLHPQGIAVNRRIGTIVVSATESVEYTSRKKDSKAKILLYSSDGVLVRELNRDVKKDNFCFPKNLGLNSNDDVCVVDGSNDCVVILDNDGNVLSKFYGSDGSNDDASVFIPADIICDKYGHIVVSDHCNGHLHFLNEAGRLLQTITLSDKNGEWMPCHLTLDCKGKLWIDNGYGGVKIFNYIDSQ